MSVRTDKSSVLGFIMGILSSIFGKSQPKPTSADLQRAEFKTSTQRLGLRFTERIREIFRHRWIKKL
jgi:hypothetical protein